MFSPLTEKSNFSLPGGHLRRWCLFTHDPSLHPLIASRTITGVRLQQGTQPPMLWKEMAYPKDLANRCWEASWGDLEVFEQVWQWRLGGRWDIQLDRGEFMIREHFPITGDWCPGASPDTLLGGLLEASTQWWLTVNKVEFTSLVFTE